MYHSRWKGLPYDAGLRYGALVLKNAGPLKPPFPLSEERRAFARLCLPLYQTHAPRLVEELCGFARGQKMPEEDIFTIFFSMYCFTFDAHCSAFAFRSNEGAFFGRNSDFLISVEKFCDSAFYRLDNGAAFIGNTTAPIQMEDGLNEHGLAAGLTMVYPLHIKPGLNAGMLVRLVLESCRTVDEAVGLLSSVPPASSHNILLADKKRDMALVQSCCDKTVVQRPEGDFIYATNHFCAKEMEPYQYQGPDDIFSHKRYETLQKVFAEETPKNGFFAQYLLGGKLGFMCQYNRSLGFDTIWSVVYDVSGGKIHRAEGHPARKPFVEDRRPLFAYK